MKHGSVQGDALPKTMACLLSGRPGPSVSMIRPARANKPNGYLLGSYRIATAPELNFSRLTSLKSIRFDSPANNVAPWPASLGCTTNSYSSINPSSPRPVPCPPGLFDYRWLPHV